jgi:uncharacterized protein
MTDSVAKAPPPAFHIMVKPRGSICNLDCDYCFYLSKEKLYPSGSFRMSDELLENFTRQYLESQIVTEINFAWQGGEPTLMGVDFFRKAVTYQKKYKKAGVHILNSMQTNGVLLNDEWCKFLHDENFLVGISIDGPQDIHDKFRRDKGGQPTFSRVMNSIKLMKKYRVEFNTLTCVQSANSPRGHETYRFLRDEVGSVFMQFIPIVERVNTTRFQEGNKVTSRSVPSKQYGTFLMDIFDEWVRRDVGKIFVQIFDSSLAAWAGYRPGLCIFEQTCGLGLAMEHNGDLYACDHFVEPGYFLGNIQETSMLELVNSEQQRKFGRDKRDTLPKYCRECKVKFICNGECPKNRFIKTPSGEDGLNYLCAGLKAFFTHIDRPMQVMAQLLHQQRPPADIMKIAAFEDQLNKSKMDDPCPCGSSLKVKQCHKSTRQKYQPIFTNIRRNSDK